ncbi:MAG: nucleotide exchange factor GrpE [Lachnospiraceae bacterium]|nr:nucleotide exchange factor GrpE [Lachnospiraceae bacterium]
MAEDIKKEMDEELTADAEKEAAEATEENTDAEEAKAEDMTAPNPSQTESEVSASSDEEKKETQTDEGAGEKDGKKLFGKKDKKKDKAQEKIEELEDKVKRQLAEFENFRNRSEKEKMAMFETGAKSVIEKILPVIDNFERGLAMIPEEDKDTPVADGMNKIYKQLVTELEALGVKPIETVGLEFDPNLHNAVMQVESEEYESGFIAQELQKGYTYRDTVVRHSMVAVVQ